MILAVDVISDVICPWCFIGKRRLEKAIAAHGGPVTVHWHPFQLNPQMPKEGISRREYRTRKFGSWERSLELDVKVVAVGATEGIQFAFERIERTPNTVDAHRLIWLADQNRCQDAVVEALFVAYFTEGRDISYRQTLIDVVAEPRVLPEDHAAVPAVSSRVGLREWRLRNVLGHPALGAKMFELDLVQTERIVDLLEP